MPQPKDSFGGRTMEDAIIVWATLAAAFFAGATFLGAASLGIWKGVGWLIARHNRLALFAQVLLYINGELRSPSRPWVLDWGCTRKYR